MEVREGGDVEVASDEDGFRGAWFSAIVVKKEKEKGQEKVVVEYRELRSDKDESKALREKVALRHLRPPPPSLSPPPLHYALYQEVDAYDNDGWWVGVVTKLLNNNNYLVYFMQTNEETPFHYSQLRPHFDFLDNKWFQPSEALVGTHSLEEDGDLENDMGTIMPYISCQNTGTRELPFQQVDDNTSAPVRRSLRHTMIKRTGETESSPSSMKKARKDIVDLETTELSSQKNGNQECHQFSASPSFDKGVDTRSPHFHHEAINNQKSFERGKTKRSSGLRKSPRKIDNHLNNVLTGEWKDEDTHGRGANDAEIPGNVIAEKGQQKSCLKTSPSEVINSTILKARDEVNPNLNVADAEPLNLSRNDIPALVGTHSLEEDGDLENNNGTIMPYISCQKTGTRELPFQQVDDNTSAPVRKPLTHTMIKRTGETESSPSSMKKARKDIVDLETTELSSQKNGNQECHQFSASPSFDKGVDTRSPHFHHEAINNQKSYERGKTKRSSGLRKSPRKIDNYLNNVLTGEWKDEDTHGTGANDAEIPGNVIAEKGQQKSCLKTSPSEVINSTILKARDEVNPNLNVADAEPLNLSRNDIPSCSLETRKPLQKKMLNETHTPMLDKDILMENTNSCTPSGSLGEGEKTFTVTIPHLEYVGYSKADQGNSGSLHGRASLRELKLLAYHSVLQALYLQGAHNWKHEILLTNLREAFSISNEEHSIELKRLTTANYD